MNDALFAIPGLMPPSAPNFCSKLVAPEDGSLCICVHCGPAGDEVNYAVDTPGWFHGVIKDPSYNYGPMPEGAERRLRAFQASMPQFITISEALPSDAIIPKIRIGRCLVPLTERYDLQRPLYWILRLPIRSLPVGDTVVEAVINGRVRKYVVQRPPFAIHSWRDITPRFQCEQHQEGEVFDVALKEGEERELVLSLVDMFDDPEVLDGAEYRAECSLNGEITQLEVTAEDNVVTVHLPALPAGCGLWKIQYKMFDDWLDLSAGDLYVLPEP